MKAEKIKVKLARCPYCNYVWVPRKKHPKMCPRCKKRFDSPWSREALKLWEQDFDDREALEEFLEKQNR